MSSYPGLGSLTHGVLKDSDDGDDDAGEREKTYMYVYVCVRVCVYMVRRIGNEGERGILN